MCVYVWQAQIKLDISSLKEEVDKLKSQIVESPEELKSQLDKMRQNVKDIKNSIVSTAQRLVAGKASMSTEAHLQHAAAFRKKLTNVWWSCRTWCSA